MTGYPIGIKDRFEAVHNRLDALDPIFQKAAGRGERIVALDGPTYDRMVADLHILGLEYDIWQGMRQWPHLPHVLTRAFGGVLFEVHRLEERDEP